VSWSQERFNEICNKLGSFLNQAGFRRDKVTFIPCSGLTGENLLKRSDSKLPWYDGPTLIQHIDTLEGPPRLLEKPLRVSVADFFKGGMGGITVAGRIEAGTLQIGDQIIVIPGNHHAGVKGKVNANVYATH
jgi:translation elongation factor EF-1alpha